MYLVALHGYPLDHRIWEPLASRAVSCPVQVEVGTSDHAPVMATFS